MRPLLAIFLSFLTFDARGENEWSSGGLFDTVLIFLALVALALFVFRKKSLRFVLTAHQMGKIWSFRVAVFMSFIMSWGIAKDRSFSFSSSNIVVIFLIFSVSVIGAALFGYGAGWLAAKLFKKMPAKLADRFFGQAALELDTARNDDLWFRLYSKTAGNEPKARAAYIEQRASELATEEVILREAVELDVKNEKAIPHSKRAITDLPLSTRLLILGVILTPIIAPILWVIYDSRQQSNDVSQSKLSQKMDGKERSPLGLTTNAAKNDPLLQNVKVAVQREGETFLTITITNNNPTAIMKTLKLSHQAMFQKKFGEIGYTTVGEGTHAPTCKLAPLKKCSSTVDISKDPDLLTIVVIPLEAEWEQ